MHRVALTGNIASGKSAVADEWRRLGAHIIDADVLARRAVEPGTSALRSIEREFGESVVVDGVLNRAALGRIVFADDAKRRALEAIIHPEVKRLRLEEERIAEASGERIVVHAIPLLFEAGLEAEFDTIVLVDAPEHVRLQRLIANRSMKEKDARAMIAAQQPAAGKRARADYVIDNDGTLDDLAMRAREVWTRLEGAA